MSGHDKELRQRKYPRVKESCKVKFHVIEEAGPGAGPAGAEKKGGVAINISGGGMCFTSDQALDCGTKVALEMTLSHLPTPVVSLAHVVWCESAGGGKFDVGVEFWWIGWADEEAQAKMLKYINQKLGELGESSG